MTRSGDHPMISATASDVLAASWAKVCTPASLSRVSKTGPMPLMRVKSTGVGGAWKSPTVAGVTITVPGSGAVVVSLPGVKMVAALSAWTGDEATSAAGAGVVTGVSVVVL